MFGEVVGQIVRVIKDCRTSGDIHNVAGGTGGEKAKRILPSPQAPIPRAAPLGGAGDSTRAALATKVVVGDFPRELLQAAFERFWNSVLVPALGGRGSGSTEALCLSTSGPRFCSSPWTTVRCLASFSRVSAPRDGSGGIFENGRADRTLEERAVGVLFGAGRPQLRKSMTVGVVFGAATIK